jgi:hypothetical protein
VEIGGNFYQVKEGVLVLRSDVESKTYQDFLLNFAKELGYKDPIFKKLDDGCCVIDIAPFRKDIVKILIFHLAYLFILEKDLKVVKNKKVMKKLTSPLIIHSDLCSVDIGDLMRKAIEDVKEQRENLRKAIPKILPFLSNLFLEEKLNGKVEDIPVALRALESLKIVVENIETQEGTGFFERLQSAFEYYKEKFINNKTIDSLFNFRKGSFEDFTKQVKHYLDVPLKGNERVCIWCMKPFFSQHPKAWYCPKDTSKVKFTFRKRVQKQPPKNRFDITRTRDMLQNESSPQKQLKMIKKLHEDYPELFKEIRQYTIRYSI